MKHQCLLLCLGSAFFTVLQALPNVEATVSSSPKEPDLPFGTTPIPFFDLATSFPPPTQTNPGALEAIRNTLALYPFAIDGKNFEALRNVFTESVVTNYSAPLNILTPLSTVISELSSSLKCVTTQHLLGTQLITVLSSSSAESITYYRAAHFGIGALADQVVDAYGQYQDTWQKQKDGTWKIVYRNLVYMVWRSGEISVNVDTDT